MNNLALKAPIIKNFVNSIAGGLFANSIEHHRTRQVDLRCHTALEATRQFSSSAQLLQHNKNRRLALLLAEFPHVESEGQKALIPAIARLLSVRLRAFNPSPAGIFTLPSNLH